MREKTISKAVIKRLPRYYRYLGDLLEQGVDRISSSELSKQMHVTASQIRQDLNNFGGFGQQGYGYNVKYLHSEIGKILGLEEKHSMIIVGAGNMGQALANYSGFDTKGFALTGIFDIKPELDGQIIHGIPVQMMDRLPEFLKRFPASIAILTLPKSAAPEAAELLIKNGIRAILNFAHVDLETPPGVVVENVHLSENLMRLSYNLSGHGEAMEAE